VRRATFLRAEPADYVLVNDAAPVGARQIKAQALTILAEQQVKAIARNCYLTTAQYLLKDVPQQ
jgi:alkyl sulfatase BDS1-like metallo-beta-lactamase superfamily hydrolase